MIHLNLSLRGSRPREKIARWDAPAARKKKADPVRGRLSVSFRAIDSNAVTVWGRFLNLGLTMSDAVPEE
jgi:hypothetical protein